VNSFQFQVFSFQQPSESPEPYRQPPPRQGSHWQLQQSLQGQTSDPGPCARSDGAPGLSDINRPHVTGASSVASYILRRRHSTFRQSPPSPGDASAPESSLRDAETQRRSVPARRRPPLLRGNEGTIFGRPRVSQLAMRRKLPLATLDKELRTAARRAGVRCVPEKLCSPLGRMAAWRLAKLARFDLASLDWKSTSISVSNRPCGRFT